MSEHDIPEFREAVAAFLEGAAPVFRPYAQYSSVSDAVYLYVTDEPSYLDRVSPRFSMMVSMQTGAVTGIVVKGVSSILGIPRDTSVSVKVVVEKHFEREPEVAATPRVMWRMAHVEQAAQAQELRLEGVG